MKQKLNAKDFILIGVLTALMWIICMIISTIMSVAGPVTNVFYPSVVAIPNGIVMMLLLAKVPKKGVFTICAAIQAILFLLVGAFWFIPIGLVIGGVICDFLVMGRKEITMKSMMVAYALFSAIFAFSAICPIKFLQSAFVGAMEKNNIAPEYIAYAANTAPIIKRIMAAGVGKEIYFRTPVKTGGTVYAGATLLEDITLTIPPYTNSFATAGRFGIGVALFEEITMQIKTKED